MRLPAGDDGLQKPVLRRIDERNKVRVASKNHNIDALVATLRSVRVRQYINQVPAIYGADDLLERYTTLSLELRIL